MHVINSKRKFDIVSIVNYLLFLQLAFISFVFANPCIDKAARDAAYAKNVKIEGDKPWVYRRTERHNGDEFYVHGSRFPGFGTTHFNFKLTNADKSNRAPNLRGKKEFNNILKSLDRNDDITYVVGDWVSNNNPWGYPKSDNFEVFMDLIGPPKSLSPEEAAKLTWTGKQAANNGFTDVKKVIMKRNKDGSVSYIRAFFSRPQSELAKRPKALVPTQNKFDVVWQYNKDSTHSMLVKRFMDLVRKSPDESLEEVFSKLPEMGVHSDLGYEVQKVKLTKNQQGQVLQIEASIAKVR